MRGKITELRLCEQGRIILKPNILYRFTVDPTCRACMKLARLIVPPTTARIKVGCRWKPGPVVIHMIDGRTALVSRTDTFSRQKWWISIDSLEIAHD